MYQRKRERTWIPSKKYVTIKAIVQFVIVLKLLAASRTLAENSSPGREKSKGYVL